MVKHFSIWRDLPQWAVWLFHAKLHDIGSNLYGIMFDLQGKQRQGCAVFYEGIGGTGAAQRRLQAYTCVHELGHCFNLLHSWQKSYAIPPQPNRPGSPSWMNYPWRFPGGEGAFWSAFPFRFDAQELVHLRHGFLNDVIMGGNPFQVGSALEDLESWRAPIEDRSGPPARAGRAGELRLRRAGDGRGQADGRPTRAASWRPSTCARATATSRSRSRSPRAASSRTSRSCTTA